MIKPKLFIICGPTAGSKSAYAMDLALKLNGAIINADSMQVYREIPIITASPTLQDKAKIPHYLYNYISVHEEFSAGLYLTSALEAIANATSLGYVPIVVGGTGLYISALLGSLNAIPDINPSLREQVRDEFVKLGKEVFYSRLISLDPAATKIMPNDSQRLMRSYEVLLQTGLPISHYHNADNINPLETYDVSVIMLKPERSFLYKCCDQRFVYLVENGALDEVKNLGLVKGTAQKALGLRELGAYLNSEISLEEAIKAAQTKTRQYAKRQLTWFSNQIKNKKILEFSSLEEFLSTLRYRFLT